MKHVFAAIALTLLIAGCSSKDMRSQARTLTGGSGDSAIVVSMTPTPDPPRAGENDLLLTIDTAKGAPIVDADVNVTATTTLTGSTGNSQTGKTNGDGTYHVDKLILPLTEIYDVKVAVQRTGLPEVDLNFTLTPQ